MVPADPLACVSIPTGLCGWGTRRVADLGGSRTVPWSLSASQSLRPFQMGRGGHGRAQLSGQDLLKVGSGERPCAAAGSISRPCILLT